MPGISYDDSGSLASYFAITVLALILIPSTISTFKPARKAPIKPLCQCSECRANDDRKQSIKRGISRRTFARRVFFLVLGWTVFAYLANMLYNAPPADMTVYDPFEILGISSSSSDKQVKKHYRKLSLQYHPDKITLGPNETMEEAETKFIEITKAYKSLTDETIRENLAKYGNPDGPQQREDKIAIPKWVVEGQGQAWVLAAYGAVLGLGIPFVVGRWWFRQRRLTRDGILNGTAEVFFHQLREDTDFLSLLSLLASALEFQTILGAKRKQSKKQRKERQARIEELERVLDAKRAELSIEESPTMKRDTRVVVHTAVARRARALLWAHIFRVELEPELQAEQLEVLRALPPLLNAITNISLAHNWLHTSLLCYQIQPALVQAVPVGGSPLAQLPGVSLEQAQEMAITKKADGRRWVEKWLKADVDGYEEAKKVAKAWPRLEITDVEFKVTDEKLVTPSSIVSLTCRARYVHPTVKAANGAARLDSVEAVEVGLEKEGDNGEVKVEKVETTGNEKVVEKVDVTVDAKAGTKTVTKTEKRSSSPPPSKPSSSKTAVYAHAPHWPAHRQPAFYVLLGDSKLDKVIVQPNRFTDIPMPNADGTPAEPRDFSLQFQAPPQANLYSFVAHFVSDTFMGADVQHPVMLRVQNPPPEPESDDSDNDDISEPEEDSLAGQMALMRGEKVKPSPVHDESEYETDTDTSSDEDGPRPGAGGRSRAINEDTDSDSD